MYAGEIATDTGLGICVLALYLSLLEKAITMEFMVHSAMGPHGMFFFIGGITFIGAIYICVFIKETKGLTDLQKKSLYNTVENIVPDPEKEKDDPFDFKDDKKNKKNDNQVNILKADIINVDNP